MPKANTKPKPPTRLATRLLDPVLYAAVIARARKERRSISALVEEALRAYVGVNRFTDWNAKTVTITPPKRKVTP